MGIVTRCCLGLAVGVALVFVGCGSDDSESSDQALESLEQATEAAQLQSDANDIVNALAADPSDAQLDDLRSRIAALRTRADELAAIQGDDPFVEDFVIGARQTRTAMVELVVVTRDLASERAAAAQRRALIRLKAANIRLRRAVEAALAALEAEDGLDEDQQNTADQILANLDGFERQIVISFDDLEALIADKQAAVAQAAAAEAASTPTCEYGPDGLPTVGSYCGPVGSDRHGYGPSTPADSAPSTPGEECAVYGGCE